MKIKKIASAASVFIAMSLVLATEVQAGPTYGRGYPRFPEEGRYPEQTSCGADNFKKHEEVIRSWNGYNIQIQYFLSPNCGSYARMNFAPRACAVFLDRTLDPYYTYEWTFVAEGVDPGINYAYTQVGYNYKGIYSRSAVVCNSKIVYRSVWYTQ